MDVSQLKHNFCCSERERANDFSISGRNENETHDSRTKKKAFVNLLSRGISDSSINRSLTRIFTRIDLDFPLVVTL